jgi:hypothetical protein
LTFLYIFIKFTCLFITNQWNNIAIQGLVQLKYISGRMRKRLFTILVPVILIALFILFTPNIISFLGIDKPFIKYVLAKLEENGKQKISVNQIHFGLREVLLGDLTLTNQTGKIRFSAQGLSFSYDIFGLLMNINEPQRAITKISLLNPVITLKSVSDSASAVLNTTDTTGFSLIQIIDQFDNVDGISLKNGKIILNTANNENLVIGQNLDGWLGTATADSFDIEAAGGLFSATQKNFTIFAHFNKYKQQISADLLINNLDIVNISWLITNKIKIRQGLINGKIHLFSPDLENILCNGPLEIKNGDLDLTGWNVRNITARANLIDNELQIPAGSFRIENDEVSFQIRVPDIFKYDLSGELWTKQLDIKTLSHQLQFPGDNQGVLALSSRFQWQAGKLVSAINIQASDIVVCSQKIGDFQTDLQLFQDSLVISKFTARYLDFRVNAAGQIDLPASTYQIALRGTRKFGQHVIFDRLTDKIQQIDIHLLGALREKRLTGTWQYEILSPADTVFDFGGDLKLENGHFHLLKNKSTAEDFSFSIDIGDIFNDPFINYGLIENPPLHQLTTSSLVRQVFENREVEGLVNGPLNNFNIQLTIQDPDQPEKQFTLTGQLSDLFRIEKRLAGNISLNNFSSKYALTLDEDRLSGSLYSSTDLMVQVNLDITARQTLNTLITFNQFNLNNFFKKDSTTELGTIDGSIKITGTPDNPRVSALVSGDRFLIHNIGYYRFNLVLVADSSLLQVDTLQVYLNNVPALKGKLALDLRQDSIRLEMSGSQVNFEDITQTLYNRSGIFSGITDYKIHMHGRVNLPETRIQLNISNGNVYDIPFDQISINAHDSMIVADDYATLTNHALVFDNFLAIKRGLYHIESCGVLPFSENGSLHLDIKFNGDLLSFLPRLDRFFVDGASFSNMNLLIGGTPANPKIEQGQIELERGELWLAAVASHVQNIRGIIEKPADSNEVLFKNFHAEVDHKSLEINTVHNIVTSDGKKLDSWYFKDLDLDFGILSLATAPGGVRLQIPGLMVEGEQGDLELTGKTERETFYFAGPVRHPYAWGKIIFAKTHFSFPFPASNSTKPDVVVQFLKNINWNVKVNPGVDLVYVRTIPAFIGDVNAEIVVDPASEGISFTGIIEDNTFSPSGKAYSSRGTLEYLDLNFRVESYGVSFDRSDQLPEVYGRAWTSIRDSVEAIPKTIYLELYAVDKETGQSNYRSRWEDFRFRLVSTDPTMGETQEQVLSYLGYSVDKIKEKATTIGGAVTENYVIRPLLRPLERRLEHYLGFDFVRFNSRIAKNIFQVGLSQWYGPTMLNNNFHYQDTFSPYMILLESSELTLGKYLAKNIYITYTGQIIANTNPNQNDFSFNHSFGVEYRFFKTLLLEFEYDRETLFYTPLYMEKPYLEDFKVRLRHSFSF